MSNVDDIVDVDELCDVVLSPHDVHILNSWLFQHMLVCHRHIHSFFCILSSPRNRWYISFHFTDCAFSVLRPLVGCLQCWLKLLLIIIVIVIIIVSIHCITSDRVQCTQQRHRNWHLAVSLCYCDWKKPKQYKPQEKQRQIQPTML